MLRPFAPSLKDAPRPPRRVVAIGDVHGRLDLLEALHAKLAVKLEPGEHRTVYLGDYIDRGPDSARVLDRLIEVAEQEPETVFLRGNHEQAMLDFLAGEAGSEAWLSWGGAETLESYGIGPGQPGDEDRLRAALSDAVPEAHLRFLEATSLIHREGDHVFVHAGLDPDVAVDLQEARALLWIRGAFLDHDGDAFEGLTIVHGHTPIKRPDSLPWRINVDTGAFWTGRLTAVVLETDGTRRFIHT